MDKEKPAFDQTPEPSYSYLMGDEAPRRSQNYGVNQRNKSYDLLLGKNGSKSIAPGSALGQSDKPSILYMWGFINGLGLEGEFEKIGDLEDELRDISFSDGHVVLLTENNRVLVRGKNDSKQLGFDLKETLPSFKMLSLPATIKFMRVECGSDFTFALGRDGEVFSWGLNIKGQLGHGHFEPVASAAQLKYLAYPTESRSPRVSRRSKDNSEDANLSIGEKVIDISCGALHSILLTNKNRIWACGYGETFALGYINRENQCTFREVPYFSSAEFFERKITKISTGVSHSACIASGTAYLWGAWGSKPQMVYQQPTIVSVSSSVFGEPSGLDQVVDVQLGDLLTVMLTSRGEVFTLGDNINGQLGLNTESLNSTTPAKVPLDVPIHSISCGANHVFCHSKDFRNIFAWGSNIRSQTLPFTGKKKYPGPISVQSLLRSNPIRIVCGSRATISVSRHHVDFAGVREEKQSTDSLKRMETQLNSEKIEKESLKKANYHLSTELGLLRQEVNQLKISLANVDRFPKKVFSSSIGIQTSIEPEDSESTFDGKRR